MPSIFEKFYSENAHNINPKQVSTENSPTSKRLFIAKQDEENSLFDTVIKDVLLEFEVKATRIFSMLSPEELKKYTNNFDFDLEETLFLAEKSYQAAMCDYKVLRYLGEVVRSPEKTNELMTDEVQSLLVFFCKRLPENFQVGFENCMQELLSQDFHQSPRPR